MISSATLISSAVICVLIPEVVFCTPCFEEPPPCEPPPCEPPPCEPPPCEPPPCEPPPCEPPPCEPPPSPPCEPPPPPPSEPPPPPPCEPSPPPPPPPPPSPPCEPPSPPPCEPPPPPPCECSSSSSINVNVDVNVDIKYYETTFTECQYVDNESERDVYIAWIEKYSKEQIKYVDAIVQYLTIQKAIVEEIKNFELFKQIIFEIYESLKCKNIYSREVDLSSQTVVFEEVKARIVEVTACLSEQSALYTSLTYCESDVVLVPIVIGLCRSVVMSQETYISEYSTCSETVTTC